ncbi:MAG TPA: hypothetical protein VGM32_05415 [Rhodopila sp.]|jgi:hypothetical protein
MHVADFLWIEWAGAVHGGPIVPHDQIPLLPLMGVGELALRGVLDQVAEQGARIRHWPTDDRTGV